MKFLKSKKDETLLKVIAGKIFTDPKEVIKKDVTASFLECLTTTGEEHLVYLVYTKTGEYSERNDFYVVEGEFDGLFPKPVEKAIPTNADYEAVQAGVVMPTGAPITEEHIDPISDKKFVQDLLEEQKQQEERMKRLHDTYRHN